MLKKKLTVRQGFTIVELMITVLIVTMVMFGIGVMVVDSQRGWNRMYNRIYSDVATGSYVARRTFDSVIRKASGGQLLLDDAATWIEVYYYADANSAVIDRYARFSYDAGDSQLSIEYGIAEPRQTLSVQTVCENVSSCVFKRAGRSAQMMLTLDDGSQTASVVTSAVMHNQ
jgi:Tfp pilus assembly protein FimT